MSDARRGFLEEPVFFPPDEPTYFGLVSTPEDLNTASDVGVVVLAGTQPGCTTIGRNRLWVTVARSLAAQGHPVIRFDYAGLGESLGGSVEYDLNRPAVDAFRGAVDELVRRGVARIVLVGTCFGSRTALAGAADDERVVSLLLLAPPVRDIEKGRGASSHLSMYASKRDLAKRAFTWRSVRRLMSSRTARRMARQVLGLRLKGTTSRQDSEQRFDAAPAFIRPLRQLVEREVPIRVVFGDGDYFLEEFERAKGEGRLGALLATAGQLVETEIVTGTVRGFATLDVQTLVADEITARVRSVAS